MIKEFFNRVRGQKLLFFQFFLNGNPDLFQSEWLLSIPPNSDLPNMPLALRHRSFSAAGLK